MADHILVVEGNHEQLVSIDENGQIRGAAEQYADCLKRHNPDLLFSITRPHFSTDPAPPPDWACITAVIFTGAGVSWAGDDAEAAPARAVMETAFHYGKPVFGSCYGLHLGVAVLGGRMNANPAGAEIAIARHIKQTHTGQTHPLYRNKPHQFDALCMHRDDVTELSSAFDILSLNAHCAVQAVATSSQPEQFWGVQYHPELRFRDIAGFMRRSDISSFSDTSLLKTEPSLKTVPADEVIHDFYCLDDEERDNAYLHQKYQLGDDITSPEIHECELANWLDLIKS